MGYKVTVEVPLFLSFFGFLLSYNINTNLIIYRTCYVVLGYNKSDCVLLGMNSNTSTKNLEALVEPTADIVSMAKTLVDSIFGAILCLFVGSWSDKFGRKPVIVMSLLGNTLMMLVMALFAALENLSPWYMLTCSIPVILTGGGAAYLTSLLSYLTDITSEENRGIRMGVFEGVMGVAVLLGTTSSPYLFYATNYATVYLISGLCCLFAMLYTIFFLPESLEVRETENRMKGFFQFSSISDMFKTTFRNREHYKRPIILLTMLALSLYFVAIFGDGSVMFLFLRKKLGWTFKKYSWYNSGTNVLWILGTVLEVYIIHHIFKVKEAILVFVGFICMMGGVIVTGLANDDWQIYLSAIIKIPAAGLSPMTRSLMSKLVHEGEVAKMFSVFNITSNLLGLVGSPIYTTLYNATINTNPGIFNFLTAGIHGINVLCLSIVLLLQRRSTRENYSRLENENSEENNPQRDMLVNG